MQQETRTLFDRADQLLKQGTQSEDNGALIEAIETYRRGLALIARPESPLQWSLAHTNLAVALETLGEREADVLADEVLVPLVRRVDAHCSIAEHRFGASGGEADVFGRAGSVSDRRIGF